MQIYFLFGVVLMIFGAIILAMLLRLGAEPIKRWLFLPEPLALSLSGIIVLGVIGGTAYLFGSRITDEFQDVVQRAGSASARIQASLQGSCFPDFCG